jgi:DNA repair exonuclease SbcCD ATPase subunit
LMIVVLQDFLPALQEILNSYLAQIVWYEVRFLQPENEWDQLELDIEIHDEKWSRSVKSLSWGQRTILKLVWMLSVSTLFRSSFLLLDETINNLDTATISQVADVLQEFITSQDITFYVVTHSPQIQQMDIRDSVIKLL